MIALLLFINIANANIVTDWLAGFCERHLVAADPYQFEHTSTDWLIRESARLELLIATDSASRSDKKLFEIIEQEMSRREHRGEY